MDGKYLLKRLASFFIFLWAALTITFILVHLMPGDPAYMLAHQYMQNYGISFEDAYQMAKASLSWDPTKPLWVRYIEYFGNLVRGNLGTSILYEQSVNQIIAKSIPWTIFVASISLLLSFMFGVYLGSNAAWRRGSKVDSAVFFSGIVLSSFPSFIVAILLVIFLGVKFGIIPIGGAYSEDLVPGFNLRFITDVLYHAIGPIIALSVERLAGYMLGMRNNAVSIIQEDFVNFAAMRGLKDSTIAKKYVRRPALLPLITSLAISLGFMFGGATLAESVFRYPGIGYQYAQALGTRDYPLIMGIFTVIITAVLLATLVVELVYPLIDPRVREK